MHAGIASTTAPTAVPKPPARKRRGLGAHALRGAPLLRQIELDLPRLSPVLRAVGGYCLGRHAQLHLRSIDEVAQQCGTVPSGVVRFAKCFGHVGFHDFKLAFVSDGDGGDASTWVPGPQQDTPHNSLHDGLHGERHDQLHERLHDRPLASRAATGLLTRLDEDLLQLGELRDTLTGTAFQLALARLRQARHLSLSYRGEFDRLIAIHLANALQDAGKSVLLADFAQARRSYKNAVHDLQRDGTDRAAEGAHIDIDLERCGKAADPEPAWTPDGRALLWLRGMTRTASLIAEAPTLTLPVIGTTLGRRVQKALSMADAFGQAL